nr:hypothetical protein [Tanacetum cinerariifolium]
MIHSNIQLIFKRSGDLLEIKEGEGEEDGRGAFVLTLESVTRLREYCTLDLLSVIAKHSRGILSKKLPPAAESKAS